MASMRDQIKREFAASEVRRRAAQKTESIKQASAKLTDRKKKEKAGQDKSLKNRPHQLVKKKTTELRKQTTKRRKQPDQKRDSKDCQNSDADKLLELVAEKKDENKELITNFLDRLWRRSMSGGTLAGKDFQAIEAAKGFLRNMSSKTS